MTVVKSWTHHGYIGLRDGAACRLVVSHDGLFTVEVRRRKHDSWFVPVGTDQILAAALERCTCLSTETQPELAWRRVVGYEVREWLRSVAREIREESFGSDVITNGIRDAVAKSIEHLAGSKDLRRICRMEGDDDE